ncbi:hypothetical protein BH10PSE15_BH10PSE15_13140 [soil metagenome]
MARACHSTFCLGSLAEGHGHQTICVVLSGTGAEGSGGLAALKAAGGFVIAQDPEEAVPDLIHGPAENQPLRIWVAGCSTGEEAYSIGMICRAAIEASGRPIKLQVFASDVDPDAIATAREGLYPLDIATAVPPTGTRASFSGTKRDTAW